jgi:hypothetical protein
MDINRWTDDAFGAWNRACKEFCLPGLSDEVGKDHKRSVAVPEPISRRSRPADRMRVLLLMLLLAASLNAQGAPSVRSPGKFVENIEDRGSTYRIYKYEGIHIYGEVSPGDYRDAKAAVRRELQRSGKIIDVMASQRIPAERELGMDLVVRTCLEYCDSVDGSRGRRFVFARIDGRLRLQRVDGWIA